MHKPDEANFAALMDRLAEIFSKPKPSDEIIATYWRALKEIPFETVKAKAESHLKRGKFFPKPFELRPREEPREEASAASKAAFEAAVQDSVRIKEELLAKSPLRCKWVLLGALIARIEVTEREGSIIREERMRFAQEAFDRLREQSGGPAYLAGDYEAWKVAIQLRPALARDHRVRGRA